MMKSISTLNMSQEDWLKYREMGLGGSDGACIFGLNPYKSAYDLYLDKIGEGEEVEDNPRMEWGRRLEQVIADKYVDISGNKVRNVNKILVHPKYNFIRGNIDRAIVGQKKVLECKSADKWTLKNWGKEGESKFPEYYFIQVHHYMLFPQFKEGGVLAVLLGGNDFRIYEIKPDPEISEMLIEGYKKFWDCVINRIPPDSKTLADTSKKWRESIDKAIQATPEIEEHDKKYSFYKRLQKRAEAQADYYKMLMQEYMQEHNVLNNSMDFPIRTWKEQPDKRFDLVRFREDHPDLEKEYIIIKSKRVFR